MVILVVPIEMVVPTFVILSVVSYRIGVKDAYDSGTIKTSAQVPSTLDGTGADGARVPS